MKSLTLFAIGALAFGLAPQAMAQHASQISIVSDRSTWYQDDVSSQYRHSAPSPTAEQLIRHPELTTLHGPIPEHWRVTRLDPWTHARVLVLDGRVAVVTWGTSRLLPEKSPHRRHHGRREVRRF